MEPDPKEEPIAGAVPEPEAPHDLEEDAREKLKAARRDMLFGALWCLGGLAVSFYSYRFTEAGGSYVIAMGAIGWGLVQAVRGFVAWVGISRRAGREGAVRRAFAVLAAVVAVATVVFQAVVWYILIPGVRAADGEETITVLTVPQQYVCERIGVRAEIPAEFTEIEETVQEETDSTDADYIMYTWDGSWHIYLHVLVDYMPDGAETIDDLTCDIAQRDSAYYDGTICGQRRVAYNGIEMIHTAGRRMDFPGTVFSRYNFLHGQALCVYYIIYPSEDYGKISTRRRVDELLGAISLTKPGCAGTEGVVKERGSDGN